MVVLLATSGIVSQTPVAFVFAEDGDGGGGDMEEMTEAETMVAVTVVASDSGGDSNDVVAETQEIQEVMITVIQVETVAIAIQEINKELVKVEKKAMTHHKKKIITVR